MRDMEARTRRGTWAQTEADSPLAGIHAREVEQVWGTLCCDRLWTLHA